MLPRILSPTSRAARFFVPFPRIVSPGLWVAALIWIFPLYSPAQIVISDYSPEGGGTLTIQQDLNFTVTVDAAPMNPILVFSNWVTSDGSQTGVDLTGNLSYQINDGPVQTTALYKLYDNLAEERGILTPNDGMINFTGFPVTANDTLTIKAGTFTFAGDPEYNLATVGTFTGSVFLADDDSNAFTNTIAVPEPSTYAALAGLATLIVAQAGRRSRRT